MSAASPTLSVTRDIPAPAHSVYALIADYRNGHPRIVPPKTFLKLEVLKGGTGAGTEICGVMRVLGKTSEFRMTVTEPEPGRVIAETDEAQGVTTMFTVDPTAAGCRVTIATWMTGRSGCGGWFVKRIAAWALRPVYAEELERLKTEALRLPY